MLILVASSIYYKYDYKAVVLPLFAYDGLSIYILNLKRKLM